MQWIVPVVIALLFISCANNAEKLPPDFDNKVQQLKQAYKSGKVLDSNGKPVIDPFTTKGLSPLKSTAENDNAEKKINYPKAETRESIFQDGVHDSENAASHTLQNPEVALKEFPRDRRNQVDWVQALDQGFIEPRADKEGKSKIQELDMDIVMNNTQFMPYVKFPHIVHTRWLACSNCHPKIFIPKENANPISMNKVLRGQYCGVCHDKVAFALFVCERCHSVPHKGSGPAWWENKDKPGRPKTN
jgi:c(7)-type cytochrome triheme protein